VVGVFAYVHQGFNGSSSLIGTLQLFNAEDSILATLLPHVLDRIAHLLGFAIVPQVGAVAGTSHLYQPSLRVACQNFLLLVLIDSEHLPESSPKFALLVLSIPIALPA